jgi:hypothetical protein
MTVVNLRYALVGLIVAALILVGGLAILGFGPAGDVVVAKRDIRQDEPLVAADFTTAPSPAPTSLAGRYAQHDIAKGEAVNLISTAALSPLPPTAVFFALPVVVPASGTLPSQTMCNGSEPLAVNVTVATVRCSGKGQCVALVAPDPRNAVVIANLLDKRKAALRLDADAGCGKKARP